MGLYLIKDFKSGKKRVAFVSPKALYACPDADGSNAHSRTKQAGDKFIVELERDTDRRDIDSVTYIETVTVETLHGKVDDKHLPACKCGNQFVRLGYHFILRDEWHDKAHIIMGFARNGMDDKVLEDRWFSRRKSAMKHLDVVYQRYRNMRG